MAFADSGGFDFPGINKRPDALRMNIAFKSEKSDPGEPIESPGKMRQHVGETRAECVHTAKNAFNDPMASLFSCQQTPCRHFTSPNAFLDHADDLTIDIEQRKRDPITSRSFAPGPASKKNLCP